MSQPLPFYSLDHNDAIEAGTSFSLFYFEFMSQKFPLAQYIKTYKKVKPFFADDV
ncbi:hypothetical protein M9R32_00845 [Paenisporosarcina quisquiliarum]|uniref:Uncharacterized protein n=1 Tax=Paenisporosarcina quisquiliarum TaxID=365346 RepID=A0A9X3LCV6_9BACL|nr:hypothetical protein [Paenisporosarcina quisquiliarum]MCZ8535732.1 hypothetical protein [Paenisporosarcina quisquiliarum]